MLLRLMLLRLGVCFSQKKKTGCLYTSRMAACVQVKVTIYILLYYN